MMGRQGEDQQVWREVCDYGFIDKHFFYFSQDYHFAGSLLSIDLFAFSMDSIKGVFKGGAGFWMIKGRTFLKRWF